jgi:predicted CXXCH cytochrome family protein
VAINQTYNATGTNYSGGSAVYIAGSAIIPDGTPANDLRNVHPVGFSYDTAAAADPDLNPIGNAVPGVAVGNIGTVMLKGSTHRVECSSCHDIHRTKGAASTSGIYTIVSTKGSQLCLTCHNK